MVELATEYLGKKKTLHQVPGYGIYALIVMLGLTFIIADVSYAANASCNYSNLQNKTIQDTAELECPSDSCQADSTGAPATGQITACVLAGLDPPQSLRQDFGVDTAFSGAGNGLGMGVGIAAAPTDVHGNVVTAGTVIRTENADGTVSFCIPAPSGSLGGTPCPPTSTGTPAGSP